MVNSYFTHNRCPLPKDTSYRIRGERPPVQGKLTVPDIVEALHGCNVKYRSIFLVKFQSMQDNARLRYLNIHCSDQIVKQIQEGRCPVRIDLPGRKSKENDSEGEYFTFIGKDSIDALTKYFDEERGWPKPGEPMWLLKNGKTLTEAALQVTWIRTFRRQGKINRKQGPVGSRYGYGAREMRDAARSFLHTHAKQSGFDMDVPKFLCGQIGQIDPLRYDRFYEDSEYVRQQYAIAESFLNIITQPSGPQGRDDKADARVQRLERQVEELSQLLKGTAHILADGSNREAQKQIGTLLEDFYKPKKISKLSAL